MEEREEGEGREGEKKKEGKGKERGRRGKRRREKGVILLVSARDLPSQRGTLAG